jgi:acetylornithine deacetylase/succinyl-diaminopimelate desuccinylase-like protein
MLERIVDILLWFCIVGCGVIGGLFFAFSTSIMTALGRIGGAIMAARVAAAFLLALAPLQAVAAPPRAVVEVREWRAANERQILAELMQLVSLPNIAANKDDILRNADALTTLFEQRGCTVSRIETAGSPVLIARRDVRSARGTLTFYMHYDGQPVNPKEWTKGQPFAPAVYLGDVAVDVTKDGGPLDQNIRVYGRSAADDKGPIIALLTALDGMKATSTAARWNLRVVLDGEEEAGSPHFDATMKQNAALARGDIAVIVDSPRHPSGLPTVFHGSRGGVTAIVTVFGARGDLHSGNYGNFVTDPTMALAKLVASMKDADGNVSIRNFYDGVPALTATELRAIEAIPNVDRKLLDEFGLARPEHPDSRVELQHNRPTLSITGIESGAVRVGTRSAIPGSASARIEMRLVEGLDPQTQLDRLTTHIREQGYHIVSDEPDAAARRTHARIARVTRAGTSFPSAKSSMDDPRTAPAVAAIRSLGQPIAQLPAIGGGLPFATFSETLSLPTIGLAVVNFDNNQHAANENLRIGHLWEAIDVFVALLTMPR